MSDYLLNSLKLLQVNTFEGIFDDRVSELNQPRLTEFPPSHNGL